MRDSWFFSLMRSTACKLQDTPDLESELSSWIRINIYLFILRGSAADFLMVVSAIWNAQGYTWPFVTIACDVHIWLKNTNCSLLTNNSIPSSSLHSWKSEGQMQQCATPFLVALRNHWQGLVQVSPVYPQSAGVQFYWMVHYLHPLKIKSIHRHT